MSLIRAGRWVALSLVVLTLFASSLNASTRVEQVRYYVHDDHTRIVLDLSRSSGYQAAEHHNPERIAINLSGVSAGSKLRNLAVGEGGIKRVRVNRLSWGTQVVLDLDRASDWKHFSLPGNGTKPNRVVIDVMPPARSRPSSKVASTPRAEARTTGDPIPVVIAVDAGHGGKDPGAMGRYGLVEKRLTLDLARRVAREINKAAGFKAVLTRTNDTYLDLPRRNAIAESKGADAFVSMHLNTARNRAARGVEIYFVSPAGAARSARQVLSDPRRAANNYGLDGSASDDILHMLVDMNQQAVLQRSEGLAESILLSMRTKSLPPTRAVKQKSFSVLRTISMPSVLVEAGFISNTHDAKIVRSESGRDLIARQVARGVVSYFRSHPVKRSDGSYVVHKVQRGDTLWKISRQYRTSVGDIRRANKLSTNVLKVGQELLVSRGY